MEKQNAAVLDLGFGTGVLTTKLYEHGCSIYGQDFSSRMIELASEKMPGSHLYQGDFTKGSGSERLGHIVSNLNIFVLGVPVVKVAQVDDSHCMYLHIVFCGRVAGNDMEGGGERHTGEPPRTLGLFVPK